MKRIENLTPGPFAVGPRINAVGAHHQIVSLAEPDQLGNRPATSILASSQDDARRIARALNCFDELMERLQGALSYVESVSDDECAAKDAEAIRALLAKAKGGHQ